LRCRNVAILRKRLFCVVVALQFQKKDFFTSRPPAIKTEKGRIPVNTFGRNPRSARRSGFTLQVLRLPAVVVRALRFNPLRRARGSPYRSLTGIHLKRSFFEIEALQSHEMFTQFLNASALTRKTVCLQMEPYLCIDTRFCR
jgi:hypothetical protein